MTSAFDQYREILQAEAAAADQRYRKARRNVRWVLTLGTASITATILALVLPAPYDDYVRVAGGFTQLALLFIVLRQGAPHRPPGMLAGQALAVDRFFRVTFWVILPAGVILTLWTLGSTILKLQHLASELPK